MDIVGSVEVVKINAIEVEPGRGAALEQMPGFLGFELLRPTAGETRYFVYTRWRSEEHFQAWVQSPAFTRGHAQAAAGTGGPVATHSQLLSFEVVQHVEAPVAQAAVAD
jgi:heme-degrading monooxygenase HmoA